MNIKRNQLKIDLLASGKTLAKAVELNQRADGFDGALVCEGVIMTPEIMTYIDPQTGEVTREYRSAEEIKRALERGTLQGRPFTNDHPPDMLTADDAPKYAKGTVLDAGEWVEADESARTRFIISDAETRDDFEGGKRCLSVGVFSDDIEEPGVWRGQPYDIRQTNLRFNHLALVDRGRHRRARARFDTAQNTTQESDMSTRRIVVDADVIEVTEEAYQVLKPKLDEMHEQKSDMPEKEDMGEDDKKDMDMEKLAKMLAPMIMKMIKGDMDGEDMDMEQKPDEEDGKGMEGMYGDKMDAAVGERALLAHELVEVHGGIEMSEAVKMDSAALKRNIVAAHFPELREAVEGATGAKLDGMYEVARSSSTDRVKTDAANTNLCTLLAPKADARPQAAGNIHQQGRAQYLKDLEEQRLAATKPQG